MGRVLFYSYSKFNRKRVEEVEQNIKDNAFNGQSNVIILNILELDND